MKYPLFQEGNTMLKERKNSKVAIELIKKFHKKHFPIKTIDIEIMTPVWKSVVDTAEKYNKPRKFTAFIGYDWTLLINGNNLHRNVIYRDNGDKVITQLPKKKDSSLCNWINGNFLDNRASGCFLELISFTLTYY
ncbi:MAG: DUF3604 domain-containing protein [Flavobacteriaceae bacterium]